MENKELKFKTNINCGGCVKAVTPHLDKAEGILKWNVDTANENKVLTVFSNEISPEKVMEVVKKAGFTIEPLP